MVEAISSYQGSNDELYELRKALLSDISNKKLSKEKQDSPKELSQKEIEKEIRLSEDKEVQEENTEENIEETTDESSGISVNASEIGVLNVVSIEAQANIETSEEEYDEEMDYNEDGEVSNEERIRYYSEKYANYDNRASAELAQEPFNAETTTFESKSEAVTNPINNNMSLINKMQANYGKTTPEITSGLSILI